VHDELCAFALLRPIDDDQVAPEIPDATSLWRQIDCPAHFFVTRGQIVWRNETIDARDPE
jgi:hypothetical protein